ncbi:MAG: hypothetical protein V4469_02105 [Patescibacteria group bacterium]
MKKLFILLVCFSVYFNAGMVSADDELPVVDDIDLESVATTTENGEVFFMEDPEPSIDEPIIDESTETEDVENIADEDPVDEVLSGTYISGSIDADETWSAENGPYYISDLYIPSGVTVTVEPGTKIYVGGYIAVFGNLVLDGTADNKIVMDLDPDYSSWAIYLDAFANLNFTDASINHVDGISTNNGLMNFKDIDFVDATDAITLNHFGSLIGENINFNGGDFGTQVVAIDNSSINLRNSLVDNGLGENHYMIQGYGGSKLNITDTKILTSFAVPIIMVGGTLDLDGDEISGGDDDGIELMPDYGLNSTVSVKATISHTIISEFVGDAIFAINPDLTITDSKILDNYNGFEFYVQGDSNLSVTNSTVVGNVTGVVFGVSNENANINLDVRNNWWGDETGPYFEGQNDLGFGDEIVGYSVFARSEIQFDPWLLKEPGKKNPVIIIPGIMGSYLNKDDGSDTEVWPNLTKAFLTKDSYLDDLMLSNDGLLTVQNNITSKDIFRVVSFLGKDTDFSGTLITKLKSDGYEEGKDLFVFPYDWRLDIADNVNGIENSQVESLKHKIDEILKETKSDKVDILAHSMGGLLAEYYIKHIGADKVDKFVDIGTPHLGAPKAEKVLMYGDDMDIKFGGLGINPDEIKKISQNFPSAYNLLPSSKYFDLTSPDYSYYLYDLGDVDEDGVVGRLSYDNTKAFLKNTGRNDSLIQNAESVHNDLDNFDPLDYGVDAYNIVGCGTPTIGKIFANNKKFEEDFHYQIKYITGDGTVPQRSAEGMSADNLFYATGVEHATMPSQSGIKNLVSSILKDDGEDFDYGANSNISTNTNNCTIPDGIIVSIHSPISLDIYDSAGHHTGPDENGDIEYGVEGVTYDTLDGNKFAFIPKSIDYRIKFSATGTGTAGVDVQDYKNGSIVRSESFENVPIESLNTKGEVVVNDDSSKILLDRNGDGNEETLLPTLSVDGDLPEESLEIVDTSKEAIHAKSSTTSGSTSHTNLNIQKFNNLNDKDTNIITKDTGPVNVLNTVIRNKDEILASTTTKEDVKLESNNTAQLASPAGFFGNIVTVVWSFITELFNKIINLFK